MGFGILAFRFPAIFCARTCRKYFLLTTNADCLLVNVEPHHILLVEVELASLYKWLQSSTL